MRRAEGSMGMAQAVQAQLYRTWVTKERPRALLGDKTTVNDQLCPGHKGGLIRGEIQGAVGDVLRGAEPPQGNGAQTPLHGHLRVGMAALQHGGIDGTGMDGITPDLIFGVLDGGDFGKDAHGTFRGVVGRSANRNDARNGGDVDNRPAASLTHGWDGILGAEKDPGAVDRHDLVPHLSGGLFNGEAADNTVIVHQDIQLPVAVHGCANGFAPVVIAGHVQVDVCRFTARGSDVGLDLSAGIVQHIAKDHPGTFTGKEFSFGGTLATGPTADQGNFAIESTHAVLLLRQDVTVWRGVAMYYTLIRQRELWHFQSAGVRSDV